MRTIEDYYSERIKKDEIASGIIFRGTFQISFSFMSYIEKIISVLRAMKYLLRLGWTSIVEYVISIGIATRRFVGECRGSSVIAETDPIYRSRRSIFVDSTSLLYRSSRDTRGWAGLMPIAGVDRDKNMSARGQLAPDTILACHRSLQRKRSFSVRQYFSSTPRATRSPMMPHERSQSLIYVIHPPFREFIRNRL